LATWTLTAQLTTGTLSVGATDRIWWTSGVNITDNVVVGSYQDGTHITNSSDVHQCSTNHVHNIKYVDATHFILDGGGSTLLAAGAPTTAQCPMKFNFSDAASVATSAGKFYAYDGTTDTTAMVGVTFQAIEQANTTWVAANGSGAAVNLANQSAATSHDFYIAASVSPTSTGAKTGKVKITLTYV
jgi:hypothetical protein